MNLCFGGHQPHHDCFSSFISTPRGFFLHYAHATFIVDTTNIVTLSSSHSPPSSIIWWACVSILVAPLALSFIINASSILEPSSPSAPPCNQSPLPPPLPLPSPPLSLVPSQIKPTQLLFYFAGSNLTPQYRHTCVYTLHLARALASSTHHPVMHVGVALFMGLPVAMDVWPWHTC